jgi:hypothetical protein
MNVPMNPATSGSPPPGSTGSNARVIAVVVGGLTVIGALIAVTLARGDGVSETITDDQPTSTVAGDETTASEPSADTTPTSIDDQPVSDATDDLMVGPEISELALATVLLLQLDSRGIPICFSGSGSVVSPSGQILTNAHVVWSDPTCTYEQLGVAVVSAIDEPPSLLYLADVVALDDTLDLAVVQIVSDINGNPVGDLDLPHIAIGDSDGVELGDPLRILGFPGIGGDTITFTRGAVSGFVAQRGIDDTRAWIKTDATIAGGNSGGIAANEAGELVAVPTTAGAGDTATTTDCRVIEDTNGDGFIDDTDSCIPIGGFINGLRPINLALGLIADAVDAESIQPVSPEIDPGTDFNTDDVVIHDVYFSSDVGADNQPTEVVIALRSGSGKLCAFWTYSGMQDGVSYDAIWRVDGAADSDASFLDDIWAGGESGEWWVCVVNDEGVTDGLYEFEFTVEGDFLASESIFVGGDRRPASITVDNQSAETICYVQISPTLSGYWGTDELGETEVIDPLDTRVFDELVTGRYDVIVRDCGLDPLNQWSDLDVTGDEVLVHPG